MSLRPLKYLGGPEVVKNTLQRRTEKAVLKTLAECAPESWSD